jgi:K+-transporting ATPase c subunit
MLRKANPDMEETAIPVELVTCSDSRFLGVFGEKTVNVLKVNFDVGRYPVTSTLKR